MRPLNLLIVMLAAFPLASAQTLPPCAEVGFSAPGKGLDPAAFLRTVNRIQATACRCPNQSFPQPLPALRWNAKLAAAALAHTQDMVSHNFFSHRGSSGSDPGTRMSAAGYAWRLVGENIAAGQPTMSAVLRGWGANPGTARRSKIPLSPTWARPCSKAPWGAPSPRTGRWTSADRGDRVVPTPSGNLPAG